MLGPAAWLRKMVPSSFQTAELVKSGACTAGSEAMLTTGPPAAGTLSSCSLRKKPIQSLAGDQNGLTPPSVPASSRGSHSSSACTHSRERAV